MGKLSLNKKKAAAPDQQKITGFFNKPSPFTVVQNVTKSPDHKINKNVETVVRRSPRSQSKPNAQTSSSSSNSLKKNLFVSDAEKDSEEENVFEKTPDIGLTKRKFKLKSKSSAASRGGDVIQSKRKLCDQDDVPSPTFKRQRKETVLKEISSNESSSGGSTSSSSLKSFQNDSVTNLKISTTKNEVPEPIIKSEIPVTKYVKETATINGGKAVNTGEQNERNPKTPENLFDDDDDFLVNADNKPTVVVKTDIPKTPDDPFDDDDEFLGFIENKPTVVKTETKNENIPKTPEKLFEDDDDDFLGFFDSPFKMDNASAPLPPLRPEGPLPLSAKLHRHVVKTVEQTAPRELTLILETFFEPKLEKKLFLSGSWLSTVVNVGDVVNIEAEWEGDEARVDDRGGTLVVNPDMLVSGTSVVSTLFCMRKAVLGERYKGSEGGSKVMLLGTIVHELLQETLRSKCYDRKMIEGIITSLLSNPRSLNDMSYLQLTDTDMRKEIAPFVDHIQYFVRKYVRGDNVAQPEPAEPDKVKKGMQRPQWKGKVETIQDIEENIWSPRLGIKGKIDLTVNVSLPYKDKQGRRNKVVPLEIKTGRPTFSAEHSGQVMLYSMMSADRREDPQSGLLLYLRSSNVSEVPAGRHETRGLVQLRNELVAYLSQDIVVDDEGVVSQIKLPEPISFQNACVKCAFLDVCSFYQVTQGDVPAAPHPMATLAPQAVNHLTQPHKDWFTHWVGLLGLEAGESSKSKGVSNLWVKTPQEREIEGQCLADVKLKSVVDNNHKFCKDGLSKIYVAGEMVIVSAGTELALSQGIVTWIGVGEIDVNLDRNLSDMPGWKDKKYSIDRYTYQGSMSSNYVALARMMADLPNAAKLRSLVIDGQEATFLKGLPREVATQGKNIIKDLNKVQQKAVFRCMMAETHALIRGMPGSGKTTTIVGLVRLLISLGKSVLLVSYTHAAVDTILVKLKETGAKFLRVGRSSRVRPELSSYTAEKVTESCTTSDSVTAVYNSYSVIATTCLATDHAAIVNRQFDFVIVDEAGQALLPSVLKALLKADRFILVGDPAQLPPVVTSRHARALGLDKSLFSVLSTPANTLDLNLQYRMNRTIASLANHLTYAGKLLCGSQQVEERRLSVEVEDVGWLGLCLSSQLDVAAVMLDTGGSCREVSLPAGIANYEEALVVEKILHALQSANLGLDKIGVIAPYSAQVKHVREMCAKNGHHEVEVGTVDQFQGRDKDVIIYSCTRSFQQRKQKGEKGKNDQFDHNKAGIMNDERRLNVAITRARTKLVIIGDVETLKREYEPFKKMLPFFTEKTIVKLTTDF